MLLVFVWHAYGAVLQVVVWLLLKCSQAVLAAEVVDLALVNVLIRRLSSVNLHAADRVYRLGHPDQASMGVWGVVALISAPYP